MSALLIWVRLNPRTAGALAVVLALLAAAVGLYLKGRHDADAKSEAARAVEVQEAIVSDAAADTKSTAIAKQHAEVAADQKEELINAVAKAPDGLPDESSVRWGCEFMRQQGRRPADVPACRAVGF